MPFPFICMKTCSLHLRNCLKLNFVAQLTKNIVLRTLVQYLCVSQSQLLRLESPLHQYCNHIQCKFARSQRICDSRCDNILSNSVKLEPPFGRICTRHTKILHTHVGGKQKQGITDNDTKQQHVGACFTFLLSSLIGA